MPRPPSPPTAAGYEAHKAAVRARQKAQSVAAREVVIPRCRNPRRRAACSKDFKLFAETYLRSMFPLPWSDVHLRLIRKIETAVIDGAMLAAAVWRGAGKTALLEAAALWSILYAHRRYAAIIGPEQAHADQRIKNLRGELEQNDLLAADFPAVCIPIRAYEGRGNAKPLYKGKLIRCTLRADMLSMPEIPRSPAAGGMIATRGLTGQIRGLAVRMPDGSRARPDIVFIDDPQTPESAHSPAQTAARERLINADILGLAGPGQRIAALAAVTVIAGGDLAERMINNPEWQGERHRRIVSWPADEKLWAKYLEIRSTALKAGASPSAVSAACNEYYSAHRAAMDAGAVVAWAADVDPGDLSALQSAYNDLSRIGREAFASEMQNEPLRPAAESRRLNPDLIVTRCNGLPRGVCPRDTDLITAMIDVGDHVLVWCVAAFDTESFTGAIIDYGAYPDQPSRYWRAADTKHTLSTAAPGAGLEGAIRAGLDALIGRLLTRRFPLQGGGGDLAIGRCLIDVGYQPSLIYDAIRASKHRDSITPSYGRHIAAKHTPMSEYPRKRGEKIGLNWILAPSIERGLKRCKFDANAWKSFLSLRLTTHVGDPGAMTFYGDDPDAHRLIADHCAAELPTKESAEGRTVDVWIQTPGRENHLFDTLVGCCVAASMGGAAIGGTSAATPAAPKAAKESYAERYKRWCAAVGA